MKKATSAGIAIIAVLLAFGSRDAVNEILQLTRSVMKIGVFLIVVFLACSMSNAADNVSVRVTAEETDLPLKGVPVRVTITQTSAVFEQQSNAEGVASFSLPSATTFALEVYGIQITGPNSGMFTTTVDNDLPTILIALSKKDIAQADLARRRQDEQRATIEQRRTKVDRADVFRAVRGFLDTLFQDEIIAGDTILFTLASTGKIVELVSDSEGFVYFKGYEAGLQPGDIYSVTCARSLSIRGGTANSCPSKDFKYKGEQLPADWKGGFPYVTIPIGANRLMGLTFDHNSTRFDTPPTLVRELTVLAKLIKSRGHIVEIQGHTDNVSSIADSLRAAQANLILSQKRADVVRTHLIEKYKVAPESVTAVGYGQEFPVADNATEAGRALNRRVMIKVRPKKN